MDKELIDITELSLKLDLINKKTGLLIKPEDPVLLSKKILLLFNNKSLRMSLGKNGFDRYHKMFTVNQMCKEYYNLLI